MVKSKRPDIPDSVRLMLWVAAGGRCEYEGCNQPLWYDALTKMTLNKADAAHIFAISKGWARYDQEESKKQAVDISNLMLLCKDHHRLVDNEGADTHAAERLLDMKRRHEERIELLTSIQEDRKSYVVLYSANIGRLNSSVRWEDAAPAMVPHRYPAEIRPIELGTSRSVFEDHEAWESERQQLRRQFHLQVKPRIASEQIPHLSIFARAPQPLLIELGHLLSDITPADVYQRHKEPEDWKWQDHPPSFQYIVDEPDTAYADVALNLSLSAVIDNSRITSVIKNDHSIWTLTIRDPHNDFLKSREQLSMFRECFRKLLDRIKERHGENAVIHLFPTVPVAIAVEIGRVRMPKADLPMRIYDQNSKLGGFVLAFDLGPEVEHGH
ncbi:MAG: SAVED domain-containing protein [Armatimonadota bacterium]